MSHKSYSAEKNNPFGWETLSLIKAVKTNLVKMQTFSEKSHEDEKKTLGGVFSLVYYIVLQSNSMSPVKDSNPSTPASKCCSSKRWAENELNKPIKLSKPVSFSGFCLEFLLQAKIVRLLQSLFFMTDTNAKKKRTAPSSI